MQLQTVSFECPFCCVTLKKGVSINIAESPQFSDGFSSDSAIHRLVQCPVCNEVFFYDGLEIKSSTDPNDICVNTIEPGIDRYFELLKNTDLSDEQQLYLRKEIWYMGNHHPDVSDEVLNNYDFKTQWLDNLEALEKLLSEDDQEQMLLKAEVNRHLGRTTRCIELLDLYKGERDPKFVKTIRKKARKGNTEVFEI
ncbi:MAG: hypothetical protein M0P66_00860 [Salinivirgaceae bacterium]|nr:hypothetical protein [Salinivirgaceae bacterium]